MSQQMKFAHAMEQMMEQSIEEAVRATFREGRSSGDAANDVDAFIHSLLVRLGLRTPGEVLMMKSVAKMRSTLAAAPESSDDELLAVTAEPPVAGSDSDAAGKERKRTVSKKMKDTFLAMEGGTEEQLTAAMRMYKAADQTQLDSWGGKWDAFARAFIAGECVLAKKPRVRAPPKPKAKAPDAPAAPVKAKVAKNFTWTPTAKKLFAEVVEGNGGTVSESLKSEFVTHINAMDAATFGTIAPVGHIRAFIASKTAAAAASAASAAPEDDDDEDEDLEAIEVEGEELTIGVTSGKIYRATEDSGDVQIGVAGQGKFKDVKIPSA